jgi:hypothetical protein
MIDVEFNIEFTFTNNVYDHSKNDVIFSGDIISYGMLSINRYLDDIHD